MIYISIMIAERTTKYTDAVKTYMRSAKHATNGQILEYLHITYPDLSATTVHRITTRMLERGDLLCAPPTSSKLSRFDFNVKTHDHFQCVNCDRLRDVELPLDLFKVIQDKLGDCKLNGGLTVQGSCAKCLKKKKI